MRNVMYAVGGFAVFVALFVLVGVLDGPRAAPPSDQSALLGQAETACQQFVRPQLKAPGTALFQELGRAAVTSDQGGTVTVTSYVDAQNSLGGMARMQYTCQARLSGGNWTLVALHFNAS